MAEIANTPVYTEKKEVFSEINRREKSKNEVKIRQDNYTYTGTGAQTPSRRESEELRKRLPEWLFVLEDALAEADTRGCASV